MTINPIVFFRILVHSRIVNLKSNCSDPTCGGGEELYTQMGFFCSVNFGRLIYSSQRNVSGIIKKLVQRRIQN